MIFIRIPGRFRLRHRAVRGADPRPGAHPDRSGRRSGRRNRGPKWAYLGYYGVGVVILAYLIVVTTFVSDEISIFSPAARWSTPWGGVLGDTSAVSSLEGRGGTNDRNSAQLSGDQNEAGAGERDLSDCGRPGMPDAKLYGRVPEEDLPWFGTPSRALVERRLELGAPPMVVAFRTTLPDPILEEAYNVGVAARYLAGTVVGPGEILSLNDTIGPPTRERGYGDGPSYVGGRVVPSVGGGICKISSAMYNAVILSGLTVVERHPHSMLVPYVPPGRDATISYGGKNFRFRNSESVPVLIWAELHGDTLYVALYGDFDPPEVQWEHEETARQRTWTTRRANPSLPTGEERVAMEGYDGVTVRTWVTTTYPDQPPERRDLGVDYYRPMPRVVEYGP